MRGALSAFLRKFWRRKVLWSAWFPLYHAWIPMWSGPVVLLFSTAPMRGKWFYLTFTVSWCPQHWPLSRSPSLKLYLFQPTTALNLTASPVRTHETVYFTLCYAQSLESPECGFNPSCLSPSTTHTPSFSHYLDYGSEVKAFIFLSSWISPR